MVLNLDEEFWDAASEGVLRLPRCQRCHRWWWYPLDVGPCCGLEYEWVEVEATGTIYTATVVHRTFSPACTTEPPYRVGLVEPFQATGVRLVSPVPEGLSIGSKVRLAGVSDAAEGFRVLRWSPA